MMYGTAQRQRRTRARVLGYHSPSAPTRSSVPFSGLELELERKLERAIRQTENNNMGASSIVTDYYRPPMKLMMSYLVIVSAMFVT